jgi:hypothetical protein
MVCSYPLLILSLTYNPIEETVTTMTSIKIANLAQLYHPTNPHSPTVAYVQTHIAMDQLGCPGDPA